MNDDITIKIRQYIHAALLNLRGVVPRVGGKKPTVNDVLAWLLEQHKAGVAGPVQIVELLRGIAEDAHVTRQIVEDQGGGKTGPNLTIL